MSTALDRELLEIDETDTRREIIEAQVWQDLFDGLLDTAELERDVSMDSFDIALHAWYTNHRPALAKCHEPSCAYRDFDCNVRAFVSVEVDIRMWR